MLIIYPGDQKPLISDLKEWDWLKFAGLGAFLLFSYEELGVLPVILFGVIIGGKGRWTVSTTWVPGAQVNLIFFYQCFLHKSIFVKNNSSKFQM